MADGEISETLEGSTRLLVPADSLTASVPPRDPAFYNPRARLNRDISVVVCAAFARRFGGDLLVLESHAGLGARGVRLANEVEGIGEVILNDLNPAALDLARRSAALNSCEELIKTSEEEACRFLSSRARRGSRGLVVDVDPFGSPSKYLDCALRACAHGGLLSVTATDLQVLHGLFPEACSRRYGGVPVRRTPYSKETALRLVLGCVRSVAARMDATVAPVFCETDMHYYRVYAQVFNRPDTAENLGWAHYCAACGRRGAGGPLKTCECGAPAASAGPLWTDALFDAEFAKMAESECAAHDVDASCARLMRRAAEEAGMPACYYTLDEVASRASTSPPRLERALERLAGAGYRASPTSLDPTGFRTDAQMPQITETIVA